MIHRGDTAAGITPFTGSPVVPGFFPLWIQGRPPGTGPKAPHEETEARFEQAMRRPLKRAEQVGHADIVVGIPFYNEAETLPHVVRTAMEGLNAFYPQARSVIVTAGSPKGGEALRSVNRLPRRRKVSRISFILDDDLLDGKGWHVRAILSVADKLGADVVLLEADLTTHIEDSKTIGLVPEWVRLLLDPIRNDGMDIVVSRFTMPPMDSPVCSHVAYPLLAALYDCPIRCLLGGQWGIAHHLLRAYLANPHHAWETEISGYGVDAWLATGAVTRDARICEAHLGTKRHRTSAGKADILLRQLTSALFQQIANDIGGQLTAIPGHSAPSSIRLPMFGFPAGPRPMMADVDPHVLILKYKAGFNSFYLLYEGLFSTPTYQRLERLVQMETESFRFPPQLWAEVVYTVLLAYAFDTRFSRGDLLGALVPLHDGFTAARAIELIGMREKLRVLAPQDEQRLVAAIAEQQEEEIANEFRRQLPGFAAAWHERAEELKPPVPPVTYREFIPGVPLIVPTELVGRGGNVVTANGVYDSVFTRHKEAFEHFVYERLNLPRDAGSMTITLAIKDFLHSVEESILPKSDFSTVRGTERAVNRVLNDFPHGDGFGVTRDVASKILVRFPPTSLLTKMGHTNLTELLEEHDPRDMLALVPWTETREYIDALRSHLIESLEPDHFEATPVAFHVVKHEDFPALVELRDSSALDKLTCRIVVSNLHKGIGGEFPKLRYLTTIAKDIVEAERFGDMWHRFAQDRKGFARKVINSIEGHWGRDPLSAHNIFEDRTQRILADRLRRMADTIWEEAGTDETRRRLAARLAAVADCYHLALVLPDGKFVTCSAWSWADYSFKGGRTSPSPLSTHVERDWASREFIIEYYKALGGRHEDVDEKIIELMGDGRESENLARILLGAERESEKFVPLAPVAMIPEQPPAKPMTRFSHNPILEPVRDHYWESKYVLNAGAVRLDGKVHLVYRAFGDDEVSRLGLAISEDGLDFSERLDRPIFEPKGRADRKGCEDPRLTVIGDRVYMAYIAFDGSIAQVALASIGADDFTSGRWQRWRRHGFVFPRFTDKDAALFPEQFEGRYAMLHRVDPHIWLTFSSHLRCPWPRKEHRILAGATSGMMWDAHKIGAGAQPLKTEFGWLLITHGVDFARVYRLGVMLLDLEDPSLLLYRSPNFVLAPEADCELGLGRGSWTCNVVFTCGAIPANRDATILGADDRIIVYYGAADTVICAAMATVGDLVPEDIRSTGKDSRAGVGLRVAQS